MAGNYIDLKVWEWFRFKPHFGVKINLIKFWLVRFWLRLQIWVKEIEFMCRCNIVVTMLLTSNLTTGTALYQQYSCYDIVDLSEIICIFYMLHFICYLLDVRGYFA